MTVADKGPTVTARSGKPGSAGGDSAVRWVEGRVRSLLPAVAACAVVAVTAAAVVSVRTSLAGNARDLQDGFLLFARLLSLFVGFVVGLWWWRRAPANPTGSLLYLATIGQTLYVLGRNWQNSTVAADLTWTSVWVAPCLALIVLGWPTGRPRPGMRRWVIALGAADAAVVFIGQVFNRSAHPGPKYPDPAEARFVVPQVWHLLEPAQGLALQAVPAGIVIVVLIRRRRSVPAAVRSLITPITIAGVVVAGSVVLDQVGFGLFYDWLSTSDEVLSPWQRIVLTGSYCQTGIVAIGVLIGAVRRRRAVAFSSRRIEVDLQSALAVKSPSAAAGATVGDPTARVLYGAPGDVWVDSTGHMVPTPIVGRKLIAIQDDSGDAFAALEVDESTALSPLLAELAVSTISAMSANERAAALANARREEVRDQSRALVVATDRGRVDLERNLHDGAQQLLVGLTLATRLAARHARTALVDTGPAGDSADQSIQQAIAHIRSVRDEILALIDAGIPAVLSGGLAGALRSLTDVCPISAKLDAVGDLARDDPLALRFYLAASEAMTNAVKHSGAASIAVRLLVSEAEVELSVLDDGIGGVEAIPQSIASRMAGLNGLVEVASEARGGTAVRLTCAVPT